MLKQVPLNESVGKTIEKIVVEDQYLVLRFTDQTFAAVAGICHGAWNNSIEDFQIRLDLDEHGQVRTGWCAPFENAGVYTHEEYTAAWDLVQELAKERELANKRRQLEQLKKELE